MKLPSATGGAGGTGQGFMAMAFGPTGGGGGLGLLALPFAAVALAAGLGVGVGGVGVNSTGGSTVVNSSLISGGLSGDGLQRANAVQFSGGNNTLILEKGYGFNGNVVSTSGTAAGGDTLTLGGDDSPSAAFDVSALHDVVQAGAAGTQYAGFQHLAKSGNSTWLVTGRQGSSSAWALNGGALIVGATAADSTATIGDVTVNSGARLGGHGTVGSVMLNSGGVLSPGNSIGTLTVNGNYTAAGGSLLQIEIDAAGNSDLLKVLGTADLQSGSAVSFMGTPGVGKSYTFLTANAVNGQFSTATLNGTPLSGLAFYQLSQSGAHDVLQILPVDAPGVAITPNQQSVARAIASLPPGDPVQQSLQFLTAPAARRAFDAFSGEIYASQQTAWFSDSAYLREAIGRRANEGCSPASSVRGAGSSMSCDGALWASAIGDWGQWNGNGDAATLNHNAYGAMFGVDRAFHGSRVGLVLGLLQGDSTVQDGRDSQIHSTGAQLGAYINHDWGRLSAHAGVALAWHAANSRRRIDVVSQVARANYQGSAAQVFGGVDYTFSLNEHTRLTPYARVAAMQLHSGAFSEGGAGSADLQGQSSDRTLGLSELGLRLSTDLMDTGTTQVSAFAQAGWQHVAGGTASSTDLNFAGSTTDFSVSGVEIPRDSAKVMVGVQARIGKLTSVDIGYRGQFGGNGSFNGVMANLTHRFGN